MCLLLIFSACSRAQSRAAFTANAASAIRARLSPTRSAWPSRMTFSGPGFRSDSCPRTMATTETPVTSPVVYCGCSTVTV